MVIIGQACLKNKGIIIKLFYRTLIFSFTTSFLIGWCWCFLKVDRLMFPQTSLKTALLLHDGITNCNGIVSTQENPVKPCYPNSREHHNYQLPCNTATQSKSQGDLKPLTISKPNLFHKILGINWGLMQTINTSWSTVAERWETHIINKHTFYQIINSIINLFFNDCLIPLCFFLFSTKWEAMKN